jgi:hypothetical protein
MAKQQQERAASLQGWQQQLLLLLLLLLPLVGQLAYKLLQPEQQLQQTMQMHRQSAG